MLLFWSLFSICLTSHLPDPSIWIKWSSTAQVLTPAFSVTPSALSSVVRLGVALCTLLSISLFSGEFQAMLNPASFHSSTVLPHRPSHPGSLVSPLCLPSCAGIHVVSTKAWSMSSKVNVWRGLLQSPGSLEDSWSTGEAQPHSYPVWLLPSFYPRCSPKHSSVNHLHPTMHSEHRD